MDLLERANTRPFTACTTDHRIVHWQRGDASSDTLWQCDRNCTWLLWRFLPFLTQLLQCFWSWFTNLHFSVMFPSIVRVVYIQRQQGFPSLLPTTLCLRNLIISVRTSTFIRGSSLCNRFRNGMNSESKFWRKCNFPRGLGLVLSRQLQLHPSIEGAHYKDMAIVTFKCHKFW